jgi:hypothetical protein
MSDNTLILSWIIYAILEYVGIVVFVAVFIYLLRKGKFKQWKERRQEKKAKRREERDNK